MKRAIALIVLLPAIVLGVDALADLTQDRPDKVLPGSRSEVILEVRVRHDRAPAELFTANGLWGACQHTVKQRLVEPSLIQVGAGRFQAVTEPAIGEHSWRKLEGCLEDATIDRVHAEVVSKRDFVPTPAPAAN